MSASILWRKINPEEGTSLDLMAPSHFMECMERAFGTTLPMLLDSKDIPVLRGLAAAKVSGADELIAAIKDNDGIEVWAEF